MRRLRNIATNLKGQEVACDLRVGPRKGYTPLFAPPEVLDNVQNVSGLSPAHAITDGPEWIGDDIATNGQIGNLQLTGLEESSLVQFLMILTDGYTSR